MPFRFSISQGTTRFIGAARIGVRRVEPGTPLDVGDRKLGQQD